mmetsp:Transcript_49373/g.123403  ORF Transcript_49373/g.123403 Transcript_49373/m.123403 type:complete len:204 (-) Transcript_49373:308-919(-)
MRASAREKACFLTPMKMFAPVYERLGGGRQHPVQRKGQEQHTAAEGHGALRDPRRDHPASDHREPGADRVPQDAADCDPHSVLVRRQSYGSNLRPIAPLREKREGKALRQDAKVCPSLLLRAGLLVLQLFLAPALSVLDILRLSLLGHSKLCLHLLELIGGPLRLHPHTVLEHLDAEDEEEEDGCPVGSDPREDRGEYPTRGS